MAAVRVLPLFEASHSPSSWNERMRPAEYAVLFAHDRPEKVAELELPEVPFCVIAESLDAAEAYARLAVSHQPRLLCKIYDHRGMVGAPLREIAGSQVKSNEVSARFRRWVGGTLLGIGLVLGAVEWWSGFQLNWPGMLGSRIGPVGAILLLTEAAILLEAARKRRRLTR